MNNDSVATFWRPIIIITNLCESAFGVELKGKKKNTRLAFFLFFFIRESFCFISSTGARTSSHTQFFRKRDFFDLRERERERRRRRRKHNVEFGEDA